ncbi:hypothetical protein [Phenylobacterium kunshanense]|uniref:Uncharacterized protein n=1 Tax=Phenylobacterium kunshanense TaxID=1445034 RepID=A0A328BSX5_9CAUL|nr:hypothetical protein [Phenylobacterium kunshanense]RAK69106.1 hypothetical protein DJ019_03620 [Phenylobacterium kunshanense]
MVRPRASCNVFSASHGVGSARTPCQRVCRVTIASTALGINRPAIHNPAARASPSPVAEAPTASIASGPVPARVNQARTFSRRVFHNIRPSLSLAFKPP